MDPYLLYHFGHAVPQLVHNITDLQCLIGAEVVEVLILILSHAPVELCQGVSPSPQQPQNHLYQLLFLHMKNISNMTERKDTIWAKTDSK